MRSIQLKFSIKLVSWLINCLLIFVVSSCHYTHESKVMPAPNTAEKKSRGRIVFDQEIHNFGTLKDGEIISYSFIFHNAGGSPVKILKAEPSCGCIDPHYSSKEILPGASSAVEVVLNTAGEWGNLIREVTIETSEGERKELQIGAYIENKQFENNLNTEK